MRGYDLESVCFCANIFYVFFISFIKMSDIVREKFYDLLSESVNNKKHNFYLTSERYNSLLNEVKKLKVLTLILLMWRI